MAPPYKTLAEYGNVPFKAAVVDMGSDIYASRTFSEDSPYTLISVPLSFAASGNNTIIAAPGSGKKLRIYKVVAIADFAVSTKLIYKSGSTALSGAMQCDNLVDDFIGGLYLDCAENEAFVINSSNPGQVSGYVLYREADV